MSWWVIESEIRVEPDTHGDAAGLRTFALECLGAFREQGATDPMLTGQAAGRRIDASFMVNTVTTAEAAKASAAGIIDEVSRSVGTVGGWTLVGKNVKVVQEIPS